MIYIAKQFHYKKSLIKLKLSFNDFKVFRPQDALSNVSQSMNMSLFKNGKPAYINMYQDFNKNNKEFQ